MKHCLLSLKMDKSAKEPGMDYLSVSYDIIERDGRQRRHSDVPCPSPSSSTTSTGNRGKSRSYSDSFNSSESYLSSSSGGSRSIKLTILDDKESESKSDQSQNTNASKDCDKGANSLLNVSNASTTELSPPVDTTYDTLSSATDEHCSWDRQIEYILVCCGFVTSVGSFLQFPHLSAQHGGGVFFVLYLILVMTCGFPMMYMEMVLGQYARGGPITAWHVVPLFQGLGICLVIVAAIIAFYNNVTLAWCIYLFFHTFDGSLPWLCPDDAGCSASSNHSSVSAMSTIAITQFYNSSAKSTEWRQQYFYKDVLGIDHATTLSNLGSIQPFIALCWITVWGLLAATLVFGPRSLGKVAYVTFGVSQILILTLLVRCCMDNGAMIGIKYFLNMRWNILGKPQAWIDAGKLMFLSLGLGTGSLTSLAGYTHFHSHCFRNAVITMTVHLCGMVLAGFIMFACLGVYSEAVEVPMSQMNFTSLDLGFDLIPSMLGYKTEKPAVWSCIYFFLLVLLQLDTQSIYVQNIVSAFLHLLPDRWRFRWKFKLSALGIICSICSFIGLVTTTQGGFLVHYFLQHSISKMCVFLLVLVECCVLSWIYGAQRLWNNVADMTGSTDSPWWKLTWRFLTPLTIFSLIVLACLTMDSLHYKSYVYPDWSDAVGWALTIVIITPLTVGMIMVIIKKNQTNTQSLKSILRTPLNWGPGPLANQEPENEPPDYVICAPDIYKPENALAILTANLYIPNLSNIISVQDPDDETEMTNGYLSDLLTMDSSESEAEEDGSRGNWSSRLDFVLSCLGYVVGLGNVWRFPYLVFRNGGGAFFIPYLVMLIFVGIPVVYMELAFGQYASLGPVTVWRAVPLFKGIGISMVLSTTLVSIYYNVINAWAFHYLFSSMVAELPWLHCNNTWNTDNCSENMFQITNCSWLNESMIFHSDFVNDSCSPLLYNCTVAPDEYNSNIGECMRKLKDIVGEDVFLNSTTESDKKLTSPAEEYFYNKVLNQSGSVGHLGTVQWELALCLLLCWVIVFICLVRGIKTSGKVAYLIVTFPFIIILVLLVRALTLEGNMQGIKFYVTPKWERLKEASVWADAAVQVFFSLSACMGGLITLSSYNKFHNNIYSDAVMICLGDTLMSVVAGFSVFASMGVLSHQLGTTVEEVIKSDIGLTFIVNPAAMSYFPISPLWSILFFTMIIMLGLSTQFVNIETVITAIIDENINVLRRKRMLVLFVVCSVMYLLGLPLTTKGGLYLLTLMDEYIAGIPIVVNGLFICIAIGWVYGVQKFSTDIKQMIGHTVSYWWKAMWCTISPIIITFILLFSAIGYESLSDKFGEDMYERWTEAVGVLLTVIPIISIPAWAVFKLVTADGTIIKRIKTLCRSEKNWGPALEQNWKNVEYYPAVNTNTLFADIEHSPLHTVSDHVDFNTSGMKVPSLSSQASLLPQPLSPKKPRDMRERAILNHAYSNPQCHQSSASIEKSVNCSIEEKVPMPEDDDDDILIVQKMPKPEVETCDASTQTESYHSSRSSRSALTSNRLQKVPPDSKVTADVDTEEIPPSIGHNGCNTAESPAVIEVEVTHF